MNTHCGSETANDDGDWSDAYAQKDPRYFGNCRRDYVDLLLQCPCDRVLEVGCGSGGTGAAALAESACRFYAGIELFAPMADLARKRLSEVVTGDVERVDLPWSAGSFDALIMSEVLEHLVDPWATLKRLRPLLKPDALVMASSPNIAQTKVLLSLLRGHWTLADKGVMDRTHLRWFTPSTFRAMFEESGFRVERVQPLSPIGWKGRLLGAALLHRCDHLFWRQINVHARAVEPSHASPPSQHP